MTCNRKLIVEAVLPSGKKLFQKLTIFCVKQSGVYARTVPFFLLLLFAISIKDCFAQSPPPPIDEQVFEQVLPTVVKKLLTQFSLGTFAGRFEKTTLSSIRNAVGRGTIRHQGDAGGSIYWLCYRRGGHRLWVVSGGEIGGPDHLVTEIVAEFIENPTETSTDCPVIPERFAPLVFDGKLHLEMSRLGVVKTLGPPSKSDATQMIYLHERKLQNGFDETAGLVLRFREDKLVFMHGFKTTTN